MSHRPRIGIHCPGTGTGGPWRYVHSLLRHIDLAEFDLTVFCDLAGGYPPRPEIRVAPLHGLISLPSQDPGPVTESAKQSRKLTRVIPRDARLLAGFFRNANRLARLLRPHNLDLFHTQETGCEEAPLAARLARIPQIVGTFHTDWTYDLHHERDDPAHQFLERVSNRSLHMAIAVSAATGRNWRRRTFLPSHRVTTIHNGIDPKNFVRKQRKSEARSALGLPADSFIVVGLGRLDEAKGFADLIDAATLLRAAVPNLLIAIGGDGPLRTPLALLAEFKGLRDTVRFLGFQPEVQPVLDAADVFALPSLCEACPYALLEAMAAGLPVLGSDVGGVREIIRETGLVLPPRNPGAWAAAIRTLAVDAALRDRLGIAGRARVAESFHERDMVRRTFAIYRDLLSGR